MEVIPSRNGKKVRAIFAGLLIATGCSSISYNDSIETCAQPDGALLEATTDPNNPNYQTYTDPAILAAEQLKRANAIQESDNKGWSDITFRNQVVGLGEVACVGSNDTMYLTPQGVELSLELRPS